MIQIRTLGARGCDNAVLVTIDTGKQVSRLLMDCGENTVSELSFSESGQIDHVFFTHYHMDHVAGFDSFFRRHYDRSDRVNHVWGPMGTGEIMGHRFRGFVWNLIGDRSSTWMCHDIGETGVTHTRYELSEAFALAHVEPMTGFTAGEMLLVDGGGFEVGSMILNHGIASIGYIVREKERVNVDVSRLQEMGLKPGPWLKTLAQDKVCVIDGVTHDAETLRSTLFVRSKGDSMAFVTDFIAESEDEQQRLATRLKGVGTLVCECQYRASDVELARKNYHMTTTWVGQLAQQLQPQRLVLTHFSDRYTRSEWLEMEEEVRTIFPRVDVLVQAE